jgi:hypothetical protein
MTDQSSEHNSLNRPSKFITPSLKDVSWIDKPEELDYSQILIILEYDRDLAKRVAPLKSLDMFVTTSQRKFLEICWRETLKPSETNAPSLKFNKLFSDMAQYKITDPKGSLDFDKFNQLYLDDDYQVEYGIPPDAEPIVTEEEDDEVEQEIAEWMFNQFGSNFIENFDTKMDIKKEEDKMTYD